MLWEEASLIIDRINGAAVTQASLIQLAISALFSEAASEKFNDVAKRLTDG